MATIGGPENSSCGQVVFILRGKQSKLLAVVSWLGVYIYYMLVWGISLIQLVLLRCDAIYWGSINTFYLKNKMLYAKEKLLWYNLWQSPHE